MIPDKNKRARPFGGARREICCLRGPTDTLKSHQPPKHSVRPPREDSNCHLFAKFSKPSHGPLGEFIDVIKQVQSRIVSQQGRSVRHLQALSRAGICNLDVECKILVFSGGCGNDPLGNPSDGYRHDNRTFPRFISRGTCQRDEGRDV